MSSKLDKNKIFSGMATEHTLKEVVTAVKSISINVGDIVMGDITVESNDVTTHGKLEDVKTKLDTINTTINGKTLNKTTSSIDISGQTLNVNTISGFTLDTTTLSTNDVLNRILNKGGDIQSNIYYTEGASVWADSAPIPTVNVLNPNGWLYTNTNTGNTMNLFYFNGLNETKTLGQVIGQYAVVTNLSTKLNDSMIFGIYTKSGTSFFTTRVTHSPVSSVDMVAGGKYLLFWGAVDEYIYPNLPRLNFTSVTTTGPANPSEEILSVTLNTNSSTPAGDVKISIEALGVVFDLEAREYNLLGSPTEYQTLVNINNNITDIEYKTNLLAFSNTTGINELIVYDRASETKLDTINTTITNKTLNKLTSSIDVSGQRVVTDISGQRVDISGQTVVTDISGQRVVTDISGQRVDISGQTVVTDISGQRVVTDISGQRVLTDISGQTVITDISGQRVLTDISGQRVVTDISGQRVLTDISGQRVDISGQRVITDISGQRVLTDISGQRVLTDISGQRVDISGQRVITDISGQRVITDISGQRVLTDISGQTVDISGQRVVTDISGQRVITDISGQRVVTDISGQRVDISGQTLHVNTISGFATESGNLLSIKTNTDKFKFGTGEDLRCEVINSGTNNLNVAVSNQISGFALETGGNLALLKANTDKNTYDGSGNLKINLSAGSLSVGSVNIKDTSGNNIYADLSGNLKTNIQNSSLNTHLYSFHNSNWVEVESAANGHLLVNASMQDGDGVSLTSTLNGLKQSLDVNVANTVPVSGTFYPATQPVSGSVNIGSGGATAGISILATDIQSSERGLITSSCLFARAPAFGGVSTSLTCITNGSRAYLETRDEDAITKLTSIETDIETTNSRLTTTNNTLSTINGKLTTTTNNNSVVGLNVYQIYPKTLIYRLAGSSTSTQTYQFLGPEANTNYDGRTFTIGINQPKNFSIYISPTNPTPTITKSVDVDYINSIGDRVVETISITNVDTDRLFGAVNINNLSWTSAPTNSNNSGTVIARNVVFRNQLSPFVSGAGVITVPNGYIGIISNLYYYATLGDSVMMYVRDKYNNLKTARYIEGINPTPGKTVNVGDINESLIAGDSVYFMNVNPSSGSRFINAIVTMTAI